MDELDSKIIMIFADSQDRFLTNYEVTARLYPGQNNAAVRASRPKIRNRISNIARDLDVLEETTEGGVAKYRFKNGVYVISHCVLQIPETDEEFEVGPVLIFQTGDTNSAIDLSSWV
jgi:hypothetical protein